MMALNDENLPLFSNTSVARAKHYIWNGCINFSSKTIQSSLIIIFENGYSFGFSLPNKASKPDLEVVLDLKDINIASVSLVDCETKYLSQYLDNCVPKNDPNTAKLLFEADKTKLQFVVEEWCLKFYHSSPHPFAVCIQYCTSSSGASLAWKEDAAQNLCCFTSGSSINNRSLLPYQDAPAALATWEAFIKAPEGYHVSMTGEEKGLTVNQDIKCDSISIQNGRWVCSYFYTILPLPLATLAIAVGKWKCLDIIPSKCCGSDGRLSPTHQSMSLKFSTESKNWKLESGLCNHTPYPCFISYQHQNIGQLASLHRSSIFSSTSDNLDENVDGFAYSSKANTMQHVNATCLLDANSVQKDDEPTASPCASNINNANEDATLPFAFDSNQDNTTSSLTNTLHTSVIPSTLVYPPCLHDNLSAVREFVPHCLSAAYEIFGPHPCPRLELVVLPRSFASLGLASPNLVFLSPCVAQSQDTSTFLRLAHEISHAWFGIIIGAADWTEEWLSEGFATYAEEIVYERALATYKHALTLQKESTARCGSVASSPVPTAAAVTVDDSSTSSCHGGICSTGAIRHVAKKMKVSDDQLTVLNISSYEHSEQKRIKQHSQNRENDSIVEDSVLSNKTMAESCPNSVSRHGELGFTVEKYSSEFVNSPVVNAPNKTLDELLLLRNYLRYRKLLQEVEVSRNDLQTLQPNKTDVDSYVPNALQKDKPFLNVHYIKGYFFLVFLSKLVGKLKFCLFLRDYVLMYHGQLVTSEIFVDYFLAKFPDCKETKDELISEWLQTVEVNPKLETIFKFENSDIFSSVKTHSQLWIALNSNKKSLHDEIQQNKLLFSEQIQLLLEYLLECEYKLSTSTLRSLDTTYGMSHQNSDVRHAWCELIIKHNHKEAYNVVSNFLTEEQAMGVYLYGELMITGREFWQDLARSLYGELRQEMEPNTVQVVKEMLYPQ